MNPKLFFIVCILFSLKFLSCNGQWINTRPTQTNSNHQEVGGKFENGEFIYNGIPKTFSPSDTSPGWEQHGQKILLTGRVYQNDGLTPAPNVILYYYHTNLEGKYLHKLEEKRSMPANELGQTHGYIRGWLKTDSNGHYFIYTQRPGIYPDGDIPAHVHVTIKEPNEIKEYYIDDFVFDDDKLLTSAYRKKMENRAGSGVVRLVKKDSLWVGERDIILGLNIPEYPIIKKGEAPSGKNIGEDVFSFMPFHAWGPDKKTKVCPVCKYGWYHGILYFVGNHPNWKEIKEWLAFFEAESRKREKYLKVYFIYGNEENYSSAGRYKELEKLGTELKLEKLALTFVPSFSDRDSEISDNKINQTVESTIILYKRSKIIDKFINLKPSLNNFDLISHRLSETINEYFYLNK